MNGGQQKERNLIESLRVKCPSDTSLTNNKRKKEDKE